MTYTPTYTFVAGNLIKAADENTNFTQAATQISDTTNGHDHDGTDSKTLGTPALVGSKVLAGIAQSGFQIVQATTFVNQDNMAADLFNSATGKNSTVSSNTARFDTNVFRLGESTDLASGDTTHDPDSYSNTSNAFDGNDSTYAAKDDSGSTVATYYLGKTFSSKYVAWVRVKADVTATNTATRSIVLETYNGSVWANVTTLASSASNVSYDGYYFLNATIQGIRVGLGTGSAGGSANSRHLFTLSYSKFASSSTVTTGTLLTLDGTEKGIVVYARNTLPTNTSMTADIKDGSTTLSAKALDTVIDVSSLSSGNLSIVFNLATTNTDSSPSFYGFGVVLLK